MTVVYLVDKSAHVRLLATRGSDFPSSSLQETFATCEVIALEVLYSARNRAHYQQLRADLVDLTWLETSTKALRRALDVQEKLVRKGQHRLSIPDLIIAATAEEHGATVLHLDKDFDLIAAVTGQPTLSLVQQAP